MSGARPVVAVLMSLLIASVGSSSAEPRGGIRIPFDGPVAPGSPTAHASPRPSVVEAVQSIGNVRVNDPILAPANANDITPAIAAIGSKVLIVWSVRGTAVTQRLQAAISENGGTSWTNLGWLPALPGDWRWGVDPCVVSDPVTNTFFVAAQCASPATSQAGIWLVTAQINGGIAWGTPTLAQPTSYGGFYWANQLHMSFDPAFAWLDLVFHDGHASPITLTHQRSLDRGATWSSAETLLTDPDGLQGIGPLVAWNGFFGPIVMSSDTFDWEQATLGTRRYQGPGFFAPVVVNTYRTDRSTLPGTFDSNGGYSIAVDRTFNRFQGRAYVAYVASCDYVSWPAASGTTIGESEPNDTPAQANTISIPGVGWFNGTITSSTDFDCISVSMSQAERLIVRATSIVTAGNPIVEPTLEIEVVAPDGVHTLGRTPFPIGQLANARMVYTAPHAAGYTFRIIGVNVASYQISLALAPFTGPALDRKDIYTTASSDAGNSWSFPAVHTWDPAGFDVANPTLVVGNDGRPYLFWQDWNAGDPDGAQMRVCVTRSSDGGYTWESPKTISTANTDWLNVVTVGSGFKTGWRIGAATTPTNLGEQANLRGGGASPEATTAETYEERVHVAWTDGREGEVNIYTASFPTGFEVAYRTTDTTVTPGEYVGLRMALENHNPLFQQWIDTPEPFCTRNWQSIHGSMIWQPGESASTTPYVVVVPDTAAAGTVLFQGSIDLGPTSYGLNTFIHVVPTTGVSDEETPLSFAAPSPNPAPTFSSFRFTLPAASEARLELFDVNGARVRTLVSGVCAAGPNARGWDLRDDDGRRVAAGLYLARLTVGGWSRTQRLAVVR